MSKICYVPKKFSREHRQVIDHANALLEEHVQRGFPYMTIRQLYYRFVAGDLIPNTERSYKRLISIIGDARLAGHIHWEHLEDRTRNLASLEHFNGPTHALEKVAAWYHVDMWASQRYRPEVWIEKDALVGVISGVCEENDIPYFSCRGYTSLSEMWRASMRLRRHIDSDQAPYIIHFGDHDPSGIDMSRDIYDRLCQTFLADCEFRRLALNMAQIEQYNPPPNPAKVTDSRYKAYLAKYGDESWELDALEPVHFRQLIEHEIAKLRDEQQWQRDLDEKQRVKEQLQHIAATWDKGRTWKDVPFDKKKAAKTLRKKRTSKKPPRKKK
jgi:hypothetical protein